MVQRSAARVVLRIRRGDRRSMTAALKQLHWLPVRYRIEYKILVIAFRALRDRTPTYIASLIRPYVPRRALRSADRTLLVVPRHNLVRLSDAAHSLVQDQLCGKHYLRMCVPQSARTHLKRTFRHYISKLLLLSSSSTPFRFILMFKWLSQHII